MKVTVTTYPQKKRPKKKPKKQKPKGQKTPKFVLNLNLIGKYRQDVTLLDLADGKSIKFRIEGNSNKSLELAIGYYIVAALWQETKVGGRVFFRYVNPVMFLLDGDLLIDLEQLEEDL